jgi:hypothetical protein
MLGQLGSEYITDTGAHAGQFGCIVALEAAVATTLVSGYFEGVPGVSATGTARKVMQGTLTSVPLPVGVPIFGLFTSITLASGKVIAYNV